MTSMEVESATPASVAAPAPPELTRQERPGLRKSAIFLAQMNKAEAGAILAEMHAREVESVTRELMRLGSVEVADLDVVMTEFHGLMSAQQFVGREAVWICARDPGGPRR